MSEQTRLSEDDREELVAFLDGELSDDDAHKVEAKLNVDAKTRAEADSLKRTWDLLDYLPEPAPSPSFTHRTLVRIAPVSRSRPTASRSRRGFALLVGFAWAAALLVAIAGGYKGMSMFLKHGPADIGYTPTDKDLVRDLRIIENKHLYELGADIDYLRELDQPDLFGDEAAGS